MKTIVLGFFTPWIAYLIITLFHILIPGKWMKGYVKHSITDEILYYRLNGFWVAICCIIIWFLLGYFNVVSFDWLYNVRWYSVIGAISFGLIYSLCIVIPYPSTGKSFFADFYLGRIENPQYSNGYIDSKMWLYMVGAIMLQLNVLSFTAHHIMTYSDLNYGIILCAFLLTYFIFDYFSFEKVHLYTYDLIAERVGFKLGFGCLTFYPYFYLIALWATVDLPNPNTSIWLSAIYILIFFTGWSLARGANMQKYYFKTDPSKSFLGIIPQTISNGNKSILVNGYWGFSRHINYLGEILMATGIALSAGFPDVWFVWLYPLYYVFLLFPRQWDDDKICAQKYGPMWEEYKQKVKYRIIPRIY